MAQSLLPIDWPVTEKDNSPSPHIGQEHHPDIQVPPPPEIKKLPENTRRIPPKYGLCCLWSIPDGIYRANSGNLIFYVSVGGILVFCGLSYPVAGAQARGQI